MLHVLLQEMMRLEVPEAHIDCVLVWGDVPDRHSGRRTMHSMRPDVLLVHQANSAEPVENRPMSVFRR